MKLSGTRDFAYREILKQNLVEVIKQDGECVGITCLNCLFSRIYAEDGRSCTKNSVCNHKVCHADVIVAKKLLKEIEDENRKN